MFWRIIDINEEFPSKNKRKKRKKAEKTKKKKKKKKTNAIRAKF